MCSLSGPLLKKNMFPISKKCLFIEIRRVIVWFFSDLSRVGKGCLYFIKTFHHDFIILVKANSIYSKTCVKHPLKNRQNNDLNDKR